MPNPLNYIGKAKKRKQLFGFVVAAAVSGVLAFAAYDWNKVVTYVSSFDNPFSS